MRDGRRGPRSAVMACPRKAAPRLGPHVAVNPAMRFGRPNVRGVSYYALVDLIGAGEDIDVIADDFGMTRGDVLVACWYADLYGTRTEKTWLKEWAEASGVLMWRGNWDAVTDPPAKPKRGGH
jgi:uncharacterized protein (DUF433 family)